MISKSKRAIAALEKHSGDLNSISNTEEGNTWKAALKDTIDLYIGFDSSISLRLDRLYFTKEQYSTVLGVIGVFTDNVYDATLKQNFKGLITSAISHIESNGVYKNPNNTNFLHHFGNAELISGTAFIILLIYGIGNYFGKLEKDREIMQTEAKLKDTEAQTENLKLENNHFKQAVDSLEKEVKTLTSKPEQVKNASKSL